MTSLIKNEVPPNMLKFTKYIFEILFSAKILNN